MSQFTSQKINFGIELFYWWKVNRLILEKEVFLNNISRVTFICAGRSPMELVMFMLLKLLYQIQENAKYSS